MSGMFPDPPERPALEQMAPVGPHGGPSYRYRGARIECGPGGHVCVLFMDGHPLDGVSFGVVGTITPLVDLWVEERRLPAYRRIVPKGSPGGRLGGDGPANLSG